MPQLINTQKEFIQVGLNCGGSYAKAHFKLLLSEKQAIETQIGFQLDWEELPNRKDSKITVRRNGIDPADRNNWPSQHKWLAETLEAFYRVFSARVKELDAESDVSRELETA